VLVTTPSRKSLVADGPDLDPRAATSVLVTLVGASVLSQVLANAGPVVVQVLAGPHDAETSGQFTAALVIARVPLFAFAAVQAVLLPGLAALVGAGRTDHFRRRVTLVGLLTVALGLAGTAGVWRVGDRLVPLLFGTGFAITRSVITLIALSGALFMVAQVLAQAMLAVGLDRWVLIGWGAGVAGLFGALVRDLPLADRAAWSLVVGSAVAMVVMLGVLVVWDRRTARSQREPAR
jgi:O-antigen/teichoic acid export membrane protein